MDTILIILLILLPLLALYAIVSCYFFILACRRVLPKSMRAVGEGNTLDQMPEAYQSIIRNGHSWLDTHTPESMTINSADGLKLNGAFYENPNAKGVMIACHGYRSSARSDFAAACEFYYEINSLSLLMIDERATGKSEGKYITFGVKESEDVLLWCEAIARRYPELPILLGGISMGASTVLMTADRSPANVKALLADCGFTSPYEEMKYVARHLMGSWPILFLPGAAFWSRLLGKFGLKEKDTRHSLAQTDLPVLLLHGQADTFVPHRFSEENRTACKGYCHFFSVPEASHGMSFLLDTEGYKHTVQDFILEHLLQV